jgi:hypothetical protein
VSTCVQSRAHCERGAPRRGRENVVSGCNGSWMPSVPPRARCDSTHGGSGGEGHVCGLGCGAAAARGNVTHTVLSAACTRFAALGHCTADEAACAACGGLWLSTRAERL